MKTIYRVYNKNKNWARIVADNEGQALQIAKARGLIRNIQNGLVTIDTYDTVFKEDYRYAEAYTILSKYPGGVLEPYHSSIKDYERWYLRLGAGGYGRLINVLKYKKILIET